MLVKDAIEKLKAMNPDKLICVQVVADDGSTWNCALDINDIPKSGLVQFRIWHAELKTLPLVEKVWRFHSVPEDSDGL